MTTVQLLDGRIVEVDESTAKTLVRAGKARDVDAPEAAVLEPRTNYARRHPEGRER